jgi:hypothetical protein
MKDYELSRVKGFTVADLEKREQEPRAIGFRVLFYRRVDDQRDPWDQPIVMPPLDVVGFATEQEARSFMHRLVAVASENEHRHQVVQGPKLEPVPNAAVGSALHYPQGVR